MPRTEGDQSAIVPGRVSRETEFPLTWGVSKSRTCVDRMIRAGGDAPALDPSNLL